MAHEVETMAYANTLPWHGLGNRVPSEASTEEILVAAGLDWLVEKRPIFMKMNNDGFRSIPNKNALIRSSDERVLTMVSDNWHPMQNQDAVNFFKEYCNAGRITMETAGSLRGGKLIWCLARLGHDYDASAGDRVNGYILIISPHEVGNSISIRTTTVRVVCANTMAMAINQGSAKIHWTQNHMKEFDFDSARDAVELAHTQLSTAEKQAGYLKSLVLSTNDSALELSRILQKGADLEMMSNPELWNKHVASVMESVFKAPGAEPGTAWGVLQGFTHWCDHVAGYNPDARMNRSWMGDRARQKMILNDNLLRMAGYGGALIAA